MSNTPFRPIRGTEAKILNTPIREGYLYFATDTGKIYMDKDGIRKPMGGSGASVLYSSDNKVVDNLNDTYYIAMDTIEDENASPKSSDLVINKDGKFYKIIKVESSANRLLCSLIAVSGTGGGGGGGSVGPGGTANITLTPIAAPTTQYIYGKSAMISFTASAVEDALVDIKYEIFGTDDQYFNFIDRIPSNEVSTFDLGIHLFKGTNKIVVTAIGENSGSDSRTYSNRNAEEMYLQASDSFNPLKPIIYDPEIAGDGIANVICIPVGGLTKNIEIYIDGEYDSTITNVTNNSSAYTVPIRRLDHGNHIVQLYLTATVNNDFITTDPLTYELAWIDKTSVTPVVWLGAYPTEITNYQNLLIPYMVYDPIAKQTAAKSAVDFYQGTTKIGAAEDYASESKYLEWDITTYVEGMNEFTIKSRNGGAGRSFSVNVLPDDRDMEVISANSMMNLSAVGRSNSETSTTRGIWTYTDDRGQVKTVSLNGFNWYNNGWVRDENGQSCLRISNGASIEIPFQALNLNYNTDYSIEIRFKVRNIKDYSTLIVNTTQAQVNGTWKDYADLQEGEEVDKNEYGYEIIRVIKKANTEKGVCGSWLFGGMGFALGTQEAYFNTGSEMVNARYREDQVITVSFVASRTSQLLYIYLNGIMSGVTKMSNPFTVANSVIRFDSTYCDIDLYDVRAYSAELSFQQVVQNNIADKKSVDLYDQNQIYTFKNNIPYIDYRSVLEYNASHPEALTMPYMVIETEDNLNSDAFTEDDDRLPYFKKNKRKVSVNFVNPVLDKAYQDGDITEDFYLAHCPSFTATNAELDVQGTSSQGYPRRNYKCKFKKAKWNVHLKDEEGNLTVKTPISKWHMDNAEVGTNVFTWKIDYMESSGSYNTGFANLMGKMYPRHPMEYYNFPGVDASAYRTTVYGFPVMTFHKHNGPSADADNPYEFIGYYNFNLDKGSNEYYGFEEEAEHPYVTNPDGSHPLIKDVAECWELSNNQGTWTSFKYPSGVSDFGYEEDNKLEVIKHFEYRYTNEEDAMDMAYDYKMNTEAELADGSKIIFYSAGDANNYLRRKYSNLEKVFNWLASTDTTKATNAPLETPVTWVVDVKYQAELNEETNQLEYKRDGDGNKIVATENWAGRVITDHENKLFNTDSEDYRLQKFIREFNQHFNKDYCLVYWIMTELLLLYDSRGKNCMLASWGPREEGGEYIWFPIFYDADTQLGINNTGIPTWEYDADASIDGTFSTAQSVLWTNIFKGFRNDLESHYRNMRTGVDGAGTGTQTALNLTTIVDSYNRDPRSFSEAYCMRGVRPMVAFNAGQYFKYLDIMYNGYIDLSGERKLEGGSWLYALQGDRDLSRQLFITNRLNYIDSWFRAATYSAAQGTGSTSMWMRINANQYQKSSDLFLNIGAAIPPEVAAYGVTNAQYPVPNLDSTPDFAIKPFLKQYVTIGYDDIYTDPIKFNETPVIPTVPSGTLTAFQNEPNVNSQLVYIPGAEYLSSVGDLSQKYLDEFHFASAKRTTELSLGSDTPNYFNDMLGHADNSLQLDDDADNQNRKPLLKKIILTGLRSYHENLNVSGSEKLEEFRALNTQAKGAVFAPGAPLHTVHLPNTITRLELIEANNLDKLIRSSVFIGDGASGYQGVMITNNPDEYRGLYINGLTDLVDINSGNTELLEMKIVGGALGYGSYELLNKVARIKKRLIDNNVDTKLGIHFENIHWSPYTKVEADVKTPDTTKRYYELTEHYTFKEYVTGTNAQWRNDVLNGRVYEYNPTEGENSITDLSLLDMFIEEYEAATNASDNRFTNLEITTEKTMPLISGDMFVNNSTPIEETDIKNYYNGLSHFANLNIYVKNVKPSKSARFIETDAEGFETVWGTQKVKVEDGWFINPWTSNDPVIKLNPTKQHYDFVGWELTANDGSKLVVTEDNWDEFSFNHPKLQGMDDFNFEAIYTIHEYTIVFTNPHDKSFGINGSITYKVAYDNVISLPEIIPYRDDSGLGTEQCWSFLGYNDTATATTVLDLTGVKSRQDKTYFAIFKQSSVYDNVHPEYFEYVDYTWRDDFYSAGDAQYNLNGYRIHLKAGLRGKITIPSTYNGKPIVAIGDSFRTSTGLLNPEKDARGENITHIFFGADSQIRSFADYSLDGSPVQYIGYPGSQTCALPPTLRAIGKYAFRKTTKLKLREVGGNIYLIDTKAFNQAFGWGQSNLEEFKIGGSVRLFGPQSFQYVNFKPKLLTIGSPEHQSEWNLTWSSVDSDPSLGRLVFMQNANNAILKVEIHMDDAKKSEFQSIGVGAFFDTSNVATPELVD